MKKNNDRRAPRGRFVLNRQWPAKRGFALCLSGVMLLSMPLNVFGSNLDDMQKEKSKTQSEINDANKNINNLEGQKSTAEASIAALDEQLTDLLTQIEQLEQDMEDKESEIAQTKEELSEARIEEERQYESMKMRIQYMYENGDSSLLEILFTAGSIADMLNEAEYVTSMTKYDRDMLEQYAGIVALVEEKEAQLEKEYEELEELEEELTKKKKDTESLIEQKTAEVNAYIAQIGAESAKAAQLQSQLASQQQQIDALVQKEKDEAEAARKAKEAQDAAAKSNEQPQSNANSGGSGGTGTGNGSGSGTGSNNSGNNNNNNNNNNSGGGTNSTGPAIGITLTNPCPARTKVSSEYGMRTNPVTGVYKLHAGIDLAAPSGTPIYAAAAGTVTAAAYSSSMGYYIYIDHGNGVRTVYMHTVEGSFRVKAGDTVSKGQQIAGVGTSGSSTGNHLHFEVRVNGVAYNPRVYLSSF